MKKISIKSLGVRISDLERKEIERKEKKLERDRISLEISLASVMFAVASAATLFEDFPDEVTLAYSNGHRKGLAMTRSEGGIWRIKKDRQIIENGLSIVGNSIPVCRPRDVSEHLMLTLNYQINGTTNAVFDEIVNWNGNSIRIDERVKAVSGSLPVHVMAGALAQGPNSMRGIGLDPHDAFSFITSIVQYGRVDLNMPLVQDFEDVSFFSGVEADTPLIALTTNGIGKPELIELFAADLVRAGASLEAPGYNGSTAALAAAHVGNSRLFSLYNDLGADLTEKDGEGCTAVMLALVPGKKDINQVRSIIDLALTRGADIHAVDISNGWTASDYYRNFVESLKDVSFYDAENDVLNEIGEMISGGRPLNSSM